MRIRLRLRLWRVDLFMQEAAVAPAANIAAAGGPTAIVTTNTTTATTIISPAALADSLASVASDDRPGFTPSTKSAKSNPSPWPRQQPTAAEGTTAACNAARTSTHHAHAHSVRAPPTLRESWWHANAGATPGACVRGSAGGASAAAATAAATITHSGRTAAPTTPTTNTTTDTAAAAAIAAAIAAATVAIGSVDYAALDGVVEIVATGMKGKGTNTREGAANEGTSTRANT